MREEKKNRRKKERRKGRKEAGQAGWGLD